MSNPLANFGGQKDAAAASDSTQPEVKEGTAGGQPNAGNLDEQTESVAGGDSAPGAKGPSLGGGDPDPVAKDAVDRKNSESSGDSRNNVVYSSHPTKRFAIGKRWQFDNATMTLTPDEADEFDKVLAAQPRVIQGQVKKLDPAVAHAIGRKAVEGRGVRGIDTTANGEPSPEAPAG